MTLSVDKSLILSYVMGMENKDKNKQGYEIVRKMKPDAESLIVKSNELVSALHDMSLQEMRLLAFICSHLDFRAEIELVKDKKTGAVRAKKDVELEVTVQDFAKMFDVSSNDLHRAFESAVERFQSKIIKLNTGNIKVSVGVLKRGIYYDGYAELQIDEYLLPCIVGLKEKFTQFKVRDIYQFSTANTFRLYEIISQYKGLKKCEFYLDDLKLKMGVENKYKRFADFKKRIIGPALKEINKYSDLMVEYDTKRKGRKINGIIFYMKIKNKEKFEKDMTTPVQSGKPTEVVEIAQLLIKNYEVNPKQAYILADQAYRTGKTYDHVNEKCMLIKARYYKNADVKTSLGGYVYKALKSELVVYKQLNLADIINKDNKKNNTWEDLSKKEQNKYLSIANREYRDVGLQNISLDMLESRAKNLFKKEQEGK